MDKQRKQERMVEDWEIQKIPLSTTGSESCIKSYVGKSTKDIEVK